MRAFRTVAAVLLSAVVLAGCGPTGASSGTMSGSPTAPTAPTTGATPDLPSSASPGTPGATGTPGTPGAAPAPPSPSSTAPGPAVTETLVHVTRSGGLAGRTLSLIVEDDGSWTRLDAKAKPTGTGKLSPEQLGALRAALRKADFAHLPRISTGGPVIYDGYMYAFVHGGFEVASDEGSMPPALNGVLDALPRFEG
ncbi:hypothetical protein OG625_12485 [Streptomyces sp. NBC_01351]|uniref:hypothetical protein n=1 Tax=Streptomyces sp. NBC_01351 TaxID=2903833 RepID=UPI002E35D9FB|nr:hypothetical protein [Streptomyces sp. NBC_01351]